MKLLFFLLKFLFYFSFGCFGKFPLNFLKQLEKIMRTVSLSSNLENRRNRIILDLASNIGRVKPSVHVHVEAKQSLHSCCLKSGEAKNERKSLHLVVRRRRNQIA